MLTNPEVLCIKIITHPKVFRKKFTPIRDVWLRKLTHSGHTFLVWPNKYKSLPSLPPLPQILDALSPYCTPSAFAEHPHPMLNTLSPYWNYSARTAHNLYRLILFLCWVMGILHFWDQTVNSNAGNLITFQLFVVEGVDDAKQEARENIFSKGQSSRIWNELYKVFL